MPNLAQAVQELVPSVKEVMEARSVGGGCISEAWRVSVHDQSGRARSLFVKSNTTAFLDNFQAERDGLVRLSQPDVIGVPKPIAVGESNERAWLVTEWIEQGTRGRDFFTRFGRDLARLHAATRGQRIGLDRDNYLGSAPQMNSPCDNWVAFFADRRIGFQLRWSIEQNLADSVLRSNCERILETLEQLLSGRADESSLLHGDLWSGNYLCDSLGAPTIIDPAIYYGCREAELGMLQLFGSCPQAFYDSYLDTFPLAGGWQRRVKVYVLYHLLNHLNLFGLGYLDQCRTLTAQILRT